MKQIWHGMLGTALGFALFTASGCTPPGKNLIDARTVVAEKQSLGCVRISHVNVYQDGPALVVDGVLNRSLSYRQQSMGHLDVAVFGPTGEMLAQASSYDRWNVCAPSTFSRTRLPLVAPKGSTVRVLFHNSRSMSPSGYTSDQWRSLWERAGKT